MKYIYELAAAVAVVVAVVVAVGVAAEGVVAGAVWRLHHLYLIGLLLGRESPCLFHRNHLR